MARFVPHALTRRPPPSQLRNMLSKNAVRVIDLFREWDEDGDGTVSKKEFRKAMPLLGLEVSPPPAAAATTLGCPPLPSPS